MENRNNSKINTAMTIACVHTMQQKPTKQTAPKIVFKGSDVQTNGCICMECSESMRMPKTYIMRWNPEISSHKLVDFEYGMKNFFDHDFYYDWSIWDYNDAEIGDKFYMLKVGCGKTGIVMQGTIVSRPYIDKDWSGKGRDVHYVRMEPECMIHPDKSEMLLTTDELSSAMPNIQWNEGHSGEKLDDVQALILDAIWDSHLEKIAKNHKFD